MTNLAKIVLIIIFLSGCNLLVKKSNYTDADSIPETNLHVEAGKDIDPKLLFDESSKGIITGPLSFPSEHIPEQMIVCAQEIETEVEFCTEDKIQQENFINGVGFLLEVPIGDYYVYAFLPESPDNKAYYNEFVTCGLDVDCESRENIVVTVSKNEIVEEIMPHDWYNNN